MRFNLLSLVTSTSEMSHNEYGHIHDHIHMESHRNLSHISYRKYIILYMNQNIYDVYDRFLWM